MVEISVIITAYNRKDFYMDAIKSVLNQTLPNDKYEIIFVSNFRDAEEFCKKERIKFVYSNELYTGRQVIDGIKVAEGRIISFLDDDDMFERNKLEEVYENFKDKNLSVYRDRIRYFFNGKIIYKKEFEEKIDPLLITKKDGENYVRMFKRNKFGYHSNSTFSILKELLLNKIEYLYKMTRAVDSLYFTIGFAYKNPIYYDNKNLTLYRLSYSSSMRTLDSIEKFIKNSFYRSYYYCSDHLTVYSMLDDEIKSVYKYEVSLSKVRHKFISKKPMSECKATISDYLRVLKNSHIGSHKGLVFASLLPFNLRLRFIKKVYEKQRRTLEALLHNYSIWS